MQNRQKEREEALRKRGIKSTTIKTVSPRVPPRIVRSYVIPRENYEKYSKILRTTHEGKLEGKTIEQLFLTIRADFFRGELDVSEFGNICNSLWWTMAKKHFDDDNPPLSEALYDGYELIFYIRKTDAKLLQTLPRLLQTIYNYQPKSGSLVQLTLQTVKKWGIEFTRLNRAFPEEKYKKYLEKFGVSDDEKLDAKSIEEMFLTLRSDFIRRKLDLDEFGLICNLLLWIMTKKHFDDDNIALANVLDGVNELSFNIRTNIAKTLEGIPHQLQAIYDYEPESGSMLHGSSAPSKDFYK